MTASRLPLKCLGTAFTLCCAIYYYLFFTYSHRFTSTPSEPSSTPPPAPTIPRTIWYKLGPKGLTPEARAWTDTCIAANPDYEARFLTDAESDEYVRRAFSHDPHLVDTYFSLPIPILKADLLRYLLLFAEGGIWSDLDVSCEGTPMDEWVAPEHQQQAGLVVGWEFDAGWGDGIVRQLTTWTIMARPGLPHVWAVVRDILDAVREATARHSVATRGLTMDMVGDVVDFTGPRRFTQSVLRSLAQSLNTTAAAMTEMMTPMTPMTAVVGELEIANIVRPKLVGDVLILPGYAFAASANTYRDEDRDALGPRLVTHHYAGSWKNSHGGELVR